MGTMVSMSVAIFLCCTKSGGEKAKLTVKLQTDCGRVTARWRVEVKKENGGWRLKLCELVKGCPEVGEIKMAERKGRWQMKL